MKKIQLLLIMNRNLVIMLLSVFYILLMLMWLPGLGATIMMSDSFTINDPRTDLVATLILIWGFLPVTIIISFVLYLFKKKLLYYSIPVFQLLIFILLLLSFPLFYGDGNFRQSISESQQHDLNLILGR